jgi:copper oxidase (laccase) domain-containing protein
MTTRQGGVSPQPWDSLNLGLFSGDSAENVHQNRSLLQSAMGVPAVYLRQVHGVQSLDIDPQTPPGLEADVVWTTHAGVACTVMAADCLPILVCHPQGQVGCRCPCWLARTGRIGGPWCSGNLV